MWAQFSLMKFRFARIIQLLIVAGLFFLFQCFTKSLDFHTCEQLLSGLRVSSQKFVNGSQSFMRAVTFVKCYGAQFRVLQECIQKNANATHSVSVQLQGAMPNPNDVQTVFTGIESQPIQLCPCLP